MYDPNVIREFARKLYSRASLVIVFYTLTGFLIPFFLGNMSGSVWRSVSDGSGSGFTWLGFLSGILLGGIGYVLGQSKAFQLKLQAQTALCQVKIEENTRPSPQQYIEERPVIPPPVIAQPEPPQTPNRGGSTATKQPEIQDLEKELEKKIKGIDLTDINLTPIEERLMALLAEGMRYTADLAKAVGTTSGQVIQTQSRLKRKFGIESNEELRALAKRYREAHKE